MAEQHDKPDWQSSTRGEKAWAEATERVAARNAEARKAGKRRRDAYERERAEMRRAASVRADARLPGRPRP